MQPPKTMMPSQMLGCPPGSIAGGLTRTRFFDGMFLTQADLSNEQVYWQMKRRLTNRALGTGVVWGLRLELDVKTQTYKLGPGYALDCCGNDLIVECPITISQSELFTRSQDQLGQADPAEEGRRGIFFSVVLQYVECPDAIRPVHRDACTPSGSACEPSRIRESCRLLLVPRCANRRGCDGITKFAGAMEKVRGRLGSAKPDESSSWAPSLARGNGKQTLGTLVMLFLHGYLATADTYNVSAESRLLAGTLLQGSASWLWDVDLANAGDDVLGEVSTALGTLAEDLCQGLLYPGPRCQNDHHGVYLGTGTMSRTGAVSSFTQWGCRREVLTGPLLDWWACQLGGEALDVIVNDVADKSCAASRERGKDEHVLAMWRQMSEVVKTSVTKKETVHPFDFVASIARTITGVGAGSGLVRMEATAPNGLPLDAVVPATAVASSDTTKHIAALIQPHLVAGAVPALARSPLRDLIADLAAKTKVADVAADIGPEVRERIGGLTVGSLLASEPESVLAQVGGSAPSAAQRGAVDQLFASAEGFVRDTAKAAAASVKTGATRDELAAAVAAAAKR